MSNSDKKNHAFKVSGAKRSKKMTEDEAEEAWEALQAEGYDVSVVDTRHQGDSDE